MNPPEVAVGAIVVDADRGLLLVRRGKPPQQGRWSIPGGRVEPGEKLQDAVIREVAEETGLAVQVDRFVGWVERIGGGFHFVILDFAAHVTGGALGAGDDADDVAWVEFDRLSPLDVEFPLVDGLAEFLRDHHVIDGPAAV